MPLGSWVVENIVNVNIRGLAGMTKLAGAASAADVQFARLTGNITAQEAAFSRYNKRVNEARNAQMGFITGGAAVGFMVIGGALAYAAKNAGDLQTAITGVQIATKQLSPRAFQSYSALALHTSGITAQDAVTIANEMATAASSGLNDPRKLHDAFTRIAKAADVLWMSPKHTDPIESVQNMSQLAHLFGIYSGAPLQHMLDRATQMQFVQPEAIKQLVTQGRIFMPSAMSAGVSEEDIWKQAMTMGQTGFLRSRGGSGLARVIEYLSGASTMTGHLSKVQGKAMGRLGLLGGDGLLSKQFLDPKGDLLLQKVVDHLEQIRNHTAPTAFLGLMQNAFLAQGGRYMSDILVPAIYNKAQQNWHQMQTMGGVDTMWKQYSDNFLYQLRDFTSNLKNIFTALALPELKPATEIFRQLAQVTGGFVDDLTAHPWVASSLFELGSGIAVFLGSVATVGSVAQVLKFLGAIEQLPNAFTLTLLPGRLAVAGLYKVGGALLNVGTDSAAAGGGLATFAAGILSIVRLISGAAALLMLKGDSGQGPMSDKAFSDVINAMSPAQLRGWSKIKQLQAQMRAHGQAGFSTLDIQALEKAGIIHPGHSGGGFGPSAKSAKGGPVSYHVDKIEINIHGTSDPKAVAKAVADLFSNPMAMMRLSALNTRTHPNIPQALSIAPA